MLKKDCNVVLVTNYYNKMFVSPIRNVQLIYGIVITTCLLPEKTAKIALNL